jgi:SAM-dependent methyltransferase
MADDPRQAWAADARVRFENLYERRPTWEIDRPQPAIVELVDRGVLGPRVLDPGCGTGEHALLLAAAGHEVWGLDISPTAVSLAWGKARAAGIPPASLHLSRGDALALPWKELQVDSVLDSMLFHSLTDEQMVVYQEQLARVLAPGGALFLLCYSEHEPGEDGPRRVKRREIEEPFGPPDWRVEAIEQVRIHTNRRRAQAVGYLATIRRAGGDQPAV